MKTKVWQRSIGAWLFFPILLAAATLGADSIWWFTSFILYITIALTVSVGYHRLFCHNAFECSEFWHWFFGIVGCISLNTSPLQWSAVHIQHHKLSDTDADPYDSNFNHYLRFKERTVTSLIGPSGCGKSTFIRTLNRMHEFIPHAAMAGEVFLDGEEAVIEWAGNDHTYGSRYYVASAQRDGSIGSLKAFVLLDMIGDRNLTIRRDSNSTPWLNDIVWASAARLGHRATFLNADMAVEDDHLPFVQAGVPSIDIIDLEYAAWHTAQDDLDHVGNRFCLRCGRGK